MPSSCFVPGCKGNYRGSFKVGSYRFPRYKSIRQKWAEALRREESDISKYSRDMPFKCMVPQCKSNYKPPYISCYKFPKDIDKQKLWLKSVHYENYKITENSRVCEIHFEKTDFETEVSAFDSKTGRTITCSLAHKRLKKGAVPSLSLPTTDFVPSKRSLYYQNRKEQKSELSTIQNRLKWTPVKSGQLKERLKPASSIKSVLEYKNRVSEEMVKRKRKSTNSEIPNKKVDSTSKINGTHSSNSVTPAKYIDAKSKQSDKPICTNPEAFAFLNVEIKREPLSDEEKQKKNPFKNTSEEHVSENMQITNVRSVSSERSDAGSPSAEVNTPKKPEENFDSNFYSKPLSMDQRDKAFGSFVTCELSDLRENPALYMKTKQSILKILTEAHFEQMSSENEIPQPEVFSSPIHIDPKSCHQIYDDESVSSWLSTNSVVIPSTSNYDNQENGIEKLKNNQKSIWSVINELMETMKENSDKLDLILRKLNNKERENNNDKTDDNIKVLSLLPVGVDDLDEVNRKIIESQPFRQNFVRILMTSGGKDARGMIFTILRRTITDDVGEKFSLTGKQIKNGPHKESFEKLPLYNVITEACVRVHNVKENIIREAISEWLMQSKFRKNRREKRKDDNEESYILS